MENSKVDKFYIRANYSDLTSRPRLEQKRSYSCCGPGNERFISICHVSLEYSASY